MEGVPTTVLPSRDALLTALSRVNDPEIRRPITELGMVKSVDVDDSGTWPPRSTSPWPAAP
jgi:ATP-binding protein involved in chromosome partitioning